MINLSPSSDNEMKAPDRRQASLARLRYLFEALQYSKLRPAMLNVWERMAVNQERASLLWALDFPSGTVRTVGTKIEYRLTAIHAEMRREKWSAIGDDDFVVGKCSENLK